MDKKQKVLAVVGPTATGKTSLGTALAAHFGGEIISCDSMQLYRGLPIGTAQPTKEERAAVPHHLVDFLPPTDSYSVSDYAEQASALIQTLSQQNRLPILVGGTGLYARAVLRGFSFEENCRDEALREELTKKAEQDGGAALYAELSVLDPDAAKGIHPNNLKRVIRALEYCKLTGGKFSEQAKQTQQTEPPYDSLMLVLSYRERSTLYQRINRRVDVMLEQGLLAEAEQVYRLYCASKLSTTAAQAIGYKEFFPYFQGAVSLEQAIEDVKRESRRYAKRQITWFSRETAAVPFYLDGLTQEEIISGAIKLCSDFLNEKECADEQ